MITTFPDDPVLDMPAYRGQRVESYSFVLVNGITGDRIADLQPRRDSDAPSITHDTTRTIKRQLRFTLEPADVERVNVLTDRVLPYMHVGGISYPLGRYTFTDEILNHFTDGNRGPFTLLDESYIIDQEMETAYSSTEHVDIAVAGLLDGLPLQRVLIEPTQYNAVGSFSAGSRRSQPLEAYTTQGDYFPSWMDNNGDFRMIRTREPADEVPNFDFDTGQRVQRGSVSFTSDLISAPNKFIVVSNSGDAENSEIVGTYSVPPSAPHSIARRGFALTRTEDLQIETAEQAEAMARNLGIRETIFERAALSTLNDPRHDSYNIIRFQGSNWLELGWSMELAPGGTMRHVLRKAYHAAR